MGEPVGGGMSGHWMNHPGRCKRAKKAADKTSALHALFFFAPAAAARRTRAYMHASMGCTPSRHLHVLLKTGFLLLHHHTHMQLFKVISLPHCYLPSTSAYLHSHSLTTPPISCLMHAFASATLLPCAGPWHTHTIHLQICASDRLPTTHTTVCSPTTCLYFHFTPCLPFLTTPLALYWFTALRLGFAPLEATLRWRRRCHSHFHTGVIPFSRQLFHLKLGLQLQFPLHSYIPNTLLPVSQLHMVPQAAALRSYACCSHTQAPALPPAGTSYTTPPARGRYPHHCALPPRTTRTPPSAFSPPCMRTARCAHASASLAHAHLSWWRGATASCIEWGQARHAGAHVWVAALLDLQEGHQTTACREVAAA